MVEVEGGRVSFGGGVRERGSVVEVEEGKEGGRVS